MAAIPDYVNDAKAKVQSAQSAVQGMAGRQYTIGDELEKILNTGTQEGKTDWANIRSTTLSDYLAEPQKARAAYRDPESDQYIFNPTQSAKVMAESIQAKEIPFFTANTLFSMFTDQEKDIIDSGVNVFKSQQAAAEYAYEAARQTYSDVLNEFRLLEELKAQEEADKLAREKFEFDKVQANKPKAGSGVDLSFLQGFLDDEEASRRADLSGLDNALEEDNPFANDPLLGKVYADQQKKKEQTDMSSRLSGVKINLPKSQAPSNTGLSIAGQSPYNFRNLNMGGINLGGY